MDAFEEISAEELKADIDIDCDVDWVLYEIALFYKLHDRSKSYFVDRTDSDVGIGLESDYAKYGIYFQGTKIINKTKTYLYLLSSSEIINDGGILAEIVDVSKTNPIEIIISDINDVSIDMLLRLYELLNIPNCVILNRISINNIYIEENDDIDFLDMSQFGSLADNTETNERLNALDNQIKYIKSVGRTKQFAIKRADTDNKMCVDVFDGLVCTFMPRGYRFCTNLYKNTTYFQNICKMYSREYMKITDYFNAVKNHLNFGMYVANEVDSHASAKCKRCDLFLFQMENNQVPVVRLVLMPISNGKIQRQTKKLDLPLDSFEYSEIDPKYLPFADVYLTECKILRNESLHCSNTFTLKMQNQKFLAVFLGFANNMKCKIAPLDRMIKWADIEIPYDKYSHVVPITVFEDGMKYVKAIYRDNYKNITLERPVVDYMDYFTISQMQYKTGRLNKDNCNIPEEAIGMYFVLSSAIRTKDCTDLFSVMDKKSLWDMGFLTYYGGPLPGLQKVFTFGYGDLK